MVGPINLFLAHFFSAVLYLSFCVIIGKERLFLEVARVLRKKIYVNAAKFRVLKCLDFSKEDIQWFTTNEHESHIHVMPMWTLASFKRLKHMSNQYAVSRSFSLEIKVRYKWFKNAWWMPNYAQTPRWFFSYVKCSLLMYVLKFH